MYIHWFDRTKRIRIKKIKEKKEKMGKERNISKSIFITKIKEKMKKNKNQNKKKRKIGPNKLLIEKTNTKNDIIKT